MVRPETIIPAKSSNKWWWIATVMVVITAVSGWLVWRFTAPVQVQLTANIEDLPFTVEIFPSVIEVRPGQVVSATYRIQNLAIRPLEAFGQIEVTPARSVNQVTVYLTQCGGLNTFQNNAPEDYEVVFVVEPAGLFGAQSIILSHHFTQAAPPRP